MNLRIVFELTGYLKSNRYNVPNHFKNYDKYRPI